MENLCDEKNLIPFQEWAQDMDHVWGQNQKFLFKESNKEIDLKSGKDNLLAVQEGDKELEKFKKQQLLSFEEWANDMDKIWGKNLISFQEWAQDMDHVWGQNQKFLFKESDKEIDLKSGKDNLLAVQEGDKELEKFNKQLLLSFEEWANDMDKIWGKTLK
jgi:hypothetical protein